MRLLLDSCAVVWWLGNPGHLTTVAREAIADPENDVFFSAASVWELGLKITRGRLEMPTNFVHFLREDAFGELEINVAHAERSFELPPHHADPFDRLLLAQSLVENLTLVTRDSRLNNYEAKILPC